MLSKSLDELMVSIKWLPYWILELTCILHVAVNVSGNSVWSIFVLIETSASAGLSIF